jgi:tetratricopeptide (TPR) repeat protein
MRVPASTQRCDGFRERVCEVFVVSDSKAMTFHDDVAAKPGVVVVERDDGSTFLRSENGRSDGVPTSSERLPEGSPVECAHSLFEPSHACNCKSERGINLSGLEHQIVPIGTRGTRMEIDPNNPVVKLCSEGIAAEMAGDRTKAAALYRQAWDARKDEYDACIVAHYLARVQPTPQHALEWNQEALRLAEAVDQEKVKAFFPSLYLNVGKSHDDLGNKEKARKFYTLAAQTAEGLAGGRLTEMVRRGAADGLERVSA